MKGLYQLADKKIFIDSLYSEVHTCCADYRAEGLADIDVEIAQKDIDFEREKSAREDEIEGIPVRHFSDAYLETLAVYRKIAEQMTYCDTFLFHGSAISVDNECYLFTAKSGTGKSTHASLWRKLLGGHAVMVNDDKPLIRAAEDGAVVYGTPWDGKHHLSSIIAVPLKAICILERAEENRIVPITKQEAFPMLIRQAYRPADPVAMEKTLTLIDRLNVSFYRLSCNMNISAAELSYNTMKGRNI